MQLIWVKFFSLQLVVAIGAVNIADVIPLQDEQMDGVAGNLQERLNALTLLLATMFGKGINGK